MGDYTTFEDIRRLFPAIDTTNLVANDVDFYIVMAESIVSGCVVTRYDLPFTTVPTLIRYISAELALIYVFDRFFTQEARSENDWVGKRREAILGEDGLLTQIKDGTILLVDDDGNEIAQDLTKVGFQSDTSTYTSTFDHGSTAEQQIDPDRIQAEEDAKN